MPRYFLHLRRGPGPDKLTLDPEGDEIENESLVRPHALRVIRKVIRTRTHAVRDWMACSFEITNEAQHHVGTVPFADIVNETAKDRQDAGE